MSDLREALEVTIARIEVKLNALMETVNKVSDDHERRIRELEKWRWSMPAGIGIAANLAVEWVKSLVGG